MELDDNNIMFKPALSTEQFLVFSICDIICSDSIGLADLTVMFRGEDSIMSRIGDVRLGLVLDDGTMAHLGSASQDLANSDPRVRVFKNWTMSKPLPLGNMSIMGNSFEPAESRLCICILTNYDIDIADVKFGADIVPLPHAYKHQIAQLDLKVGMIFFNKGNLSLLRGATNVRDLDEVLGQVTFRDLGSGSGVGSEPGAEPRTEPAPKPESHRQSQPQTWVGVIQDCAYAPQNWAQIQKGKNRII